MNLQRLRYFQAAAEFGSLRKAAEALQLSQPALSRQIQILEHELKAPLFLRTDKRLSLTEAGQLLAARAPSILGEVDEVRRRIETMARQRKTHVTVGAIQSTCTYLLPLAIRAFRARYPAMQIAVQGSRSSEIIERVGRRALDVGIVAAPVLDPRLVAVPLALDPFALVAPAGHRFCRASAIGIEDAANEPFITFPRGFLIRESIEAAFVAAGRELDVVVELESIEAIKELVRQGAGVSLLPRSTMIGETARRELASIRLHGDLIVREIIAVHHAGDTVAPPIRFLRETIGEVLSRDGPALARLS
jgi:DNA-binding transcriptional LysR family regulator